MTDHEIAEQLNDMMLEMKNMLTEAERLLRQRNSEVGDMTYERARQYWVANMRVALSDDHTYMSRGNHTMADTIAELENGDCDE